MDGYINQGIKTYEKLVLLCFIVIFMMIASYLYFGDRIFIVIAIINLLQIIFTRYVHNKMIQTSKRNYIQQFLEGNN